MLHSICRIRLASTRMFRFRSHHDSEIEVRQVDKDELTYALFSATRGWTHTTRLRLFGQSKEVAARWRPIAAKAAAEKIRAFQIFDTNGLPLSLPALTDVFDQAIAAFPGAIGKLWTCPQQERHNDARRAAASMLYRALEPYEVLTDAPYGESLFFPEITAPPYAFAATWP